MDRSRAAEIRLPTSDAKRSNAASLPPGGNDDERLGIRIIYTTHHGTVAALQMASQLGANLSVCPEVLMLYAVPYTLPLEEPAVPTGFLEAQIHALARESPTEMKARVILCREPKRSLRQILSVHSLVLIGGKKRWWPTKEQRLAHLLAEEGHRVIFVGCE
jgi:hypothetical protein